MTRLEQIGKKKEKLVVGLMSGTSVDSIDAVLVKVRGSGTSTTFKQLAFHTHRYPKGFKEFVLQNSLPGTGSVDTISALNILCATFFADAVLALIKKTGLSIAKIDLIGSHGQTIHHVPQSRSLFGKNIRSTLQIGDPTTIAKLTGIVTVGNFRTGDMALGGQGAPLVPYFDFLAFRSSRLNRAILNIGGIANITLLKKNCAANDVFAFDTGPGNMIVDALMKHYYGKQFDRRGAAAAKGKILPLLLREMMQNPYFKKNPPKSTGRELFGAAFIENIIRCSAKSSANDVIATATEFTALTVYDQFSRFLRKQLGGQPLHELIISGGGSKNDMIIGSLKKYFLPASVCVSDEFGVPSDSKEALCFALLANETLCGNPSNIPSVTGASRGTILGTISL